MLDAIVHLRDAVLAVTMGMAGINAGGPAKSAPEAPADPLPQQMTPAERPGAIPGSPVSGVKGKCKSPSDAQKVSASLAISEIEGGGFALLPSD